MYCPENILFDSKHLMITHYASSDFITWKRVPFMQKINPLRYQICINPKSHNQNARMVVINNDGVWAINFSNFIFKIKQKLKAV